MPVYTKLKGITHLGDSLLNEQLKANLVEYFNWALLEIGAFTNITIPSSGAFGGHYHRLRLSEDPNYTRGQVWEGARGDWVWQTGIEYGYQPINISGVRVNGTFYGSGTSGTYAHKINYPLGRVIFDTAIATTCQVTMEYSHRYFHVAQSDTPWFREIMFNSYRVDSEDFLRVGSGLWSTLAQTRVQLPAIVIETVPRRTLKGKQLGGGQWVSQDVLFHIFSETPWDRDKAVDILTYQKDFTIMLFDKNLMLSQSKYPLDFEGSRVANALMYPDLIKPTGEGGCFWNKLFFKEMNSQEITQIPPLYMGIVRGTFEIDINNI